MTGKATAAASVLVTATPNPIGSFTVDNFLSRTYLCYAGRSGPRTVACELAARERHGHSASTSLYLARNIGNYMWAHTGQ